MADALSAHFSKRFPSGTIVQGRLATPPRAGSITVLFGPSGSGKTTTLRCLAGLEIPDQGSIRFGTETWFDAAKRVCLPPQQRRVGFVFQDYALFPHLDVTANIDYGLGDLPAAERRQRVREIMERFELTPLAKQRPRQLSGGEQQRVALARALVGRPRLLLLDEPLSAIDAVLREELRGFLRTMLLACRIPVVLVTHDRAEALALGDELVVMSGGTVLQSGPVLEVFNRPIDPAVARIVHVETLHPGKIRCLSEGLATVVVGNTEIIAIAPNTAGTDVLICIRGEDVILERGSGSPSSVRNRLPARVIAIHAGAPLQRVELDAGFPLFALVTRLGSEELGLKVGEQVIALIKAPAIHLIARAK